MAGFHTLTQPDPDSLAARTYKPLLQPGLHKIIGFGRRTQGLIVAPGNPLGLHSLHDVARTGARFVNRPMGSGTRVLLDDLLADAGLSAAALSGYADTEPSHAAVAQAVAAGQADAGLGIELAARSRGLDFVPLAHEDYHLVCLKSALEQPAIQALRATLHSAAWQERMAALAGYTCTRCGDILSLRERLPWWTFRPKKRPIPASDGHR